MANPWPSRSVQAALALVMALALWGDLSRLQDPLGDKLLFYMPPGAADFIAPYQGARALVAGEDPYRNQREEFRDPWHRETNVDGARTSQFYPPTHLLLLAPLVLVYGDDLRGAGRAFFVANFLALLLLGVVVGRLVHRALPAPPNAAPTNSASSLPAVTIFCVAATALHGGALLGLERGNSDALIALASWAAILAALDGKFARAAALATLATLLKGYALLVPLAVLALVIDRRQLARAAIGAAAAIAVGLVPVARYVPAALHNIAARVGNFHAAWYNVSFRSLTEVTTPAAARPLAWLCCALALVAAVTAALVARRSDGAARTRWIVLATSAALIATLGAPAVTYTYALANVLPGMLLLACTHDELAATLLHSPRGRMLLVATTLVIVTCAYELRLLSDILPLATIAMLLYSAAVAFLAARASSQRG